MCKEYIGIFCFPKVACPYPYVFDIGATRLYLKIFQSSKQKELATQAYLQQPVGEICISTEISQ